MTNATHQQTTDNDLSISRVEMLSLPFSNDQTTDLFYPCNLLLHRMWTTGRSETMTISQMSGVETMSTTRLIKMLQLHIRLNFLTTHEKEAIQTELQKREDFSNDNE